MSVNEESNQPISKDEAASCAPTSTPDETTLSTPKKPSRLYARLKPSPSSTPAGTKSTSGSSFGKEEKIVMDNLPVRATAPASLLDGEPSERPRRNSRSSFSQETSARTTEESSAPKNDTSSEEHTQKVRPGRQEGEEGSGPVFEIYSEDDDSSPSQIQEFRPSRDHTRKRENSRSSRQREESHSQTKPSTGFFAWLKSLFSSDSETSSQTRSRDGFRTTNRNGSQRSDQNRRPRGSRGGQNRGNNQRRSRNSSSRNRNNSSR